MAKSPDAFRTISEVAELLDVPAHVLRFWESRFTQIRPVKRAGGRRYYRRGDIQLLDGIRKLLHDDGMTIRGVQKMLREDGVKRIASMGAIDLGDGVEGTEDGAETQSAAESGAEAPVAMDVPPEPEERRVLPFQPRGSVERRAEAEPGAEPETSGPEPEGVAEPPAATAGLVEETAGAEETQAQFDLGAVAPEAEPDLAGMPGGADTAPGPEIAPSAEEPPEVPAQPAAGPAKPAVSLALGIGPDPADDDPAYAEPLIDTSRLPRDPDRLRPLYIRLLAIRTRMGERARRAGPPGM